MMNQMTSSKLYTSHGTKPKKLTTVFIVNGAPRAGKDTLIGFLETLLQEQKAFTSSFSSIDPIRMMLADYGVSTFRKTPADRKLLATMGQALEEHSHFRSAACIDHVYEVDETFGPQERVVFLHIREPVVIDYVTQKLRDTGHAVWRIQVISNRSEEPTNETDAGTGQMLYDYTVYNMGTLEHLNQEAKALLSLVNTSHTPKDLARPISAVIGE